MAEQLQGQKQADAPPLVTVAMPVFNAGKHLKLAVLSIVKQTFTDWELLVVDDGSTDNALQEIADMADPRIQILRDGANKGLAARLNEAIDLARGRYFARMDHDDVSYPERFSRQVQALQADDELDLVAVRAITISSDNQFMGRLPWALSDKEICAQPWRGFYLPHPTWMGKTAWFRKHRYATPGPYFCEDQELLLRSYEDSQFGMIAEPLFAYRIREKIDWRKLIKTRLTVLQIQLRHFTAKRKLVFAFMALFVFVGRVISDVLKMFSWIIGPRFSSDSEEMAIRWDSVLHFVQKHDS